MYLTSQGRIQDFHLGRGGGGGGRKRLCARAPITARNSKYLIRRKPLGDFDALSCYLSLMFKHSDTKWDLKKYSRLYFRGSACCAPSQSATANFLRHPYSCMCHFVYNSILIMHLIYYNEWHTLYHSSNQSKLKVLGKSVGLCKTTKRKDQLYISLLVSVWRIICENFNPNGLILAEIWIKI